MSHTPLSPPRFEIVFDIIKRWIIRPLFPWLLFYYVSPAGDDSNSGSFFRPWRTIQKAANSLTARDVVMVRDGVYNETVTVMSSGNNTDGYIRFLAHNRQRPPILDGRRITVPLNDNGMFFIQDKSYIREAMGWGAMASALEIVLSNCNSWPSPVSCTSWPAHSI